MMCLKVRRGLMMWDGFWKKNADFIKNIYKNEQDKQISFYKIPTSKAKTTNGCTTSPQGKSRKSAHDRHQ